MPFLSMVRRAAVETRSLIQRFSEATQKRRSWRFGRKRRRVLFMACETLLPVVVRLPVTWHTRDIRTSKGNGASLSQGGGGPSVGASDDAYGHDTGGFSGCRRWEESCFLTHPVQTWPLMGKADRTQPAAHYAAPQRSVPVQGRSLRH